MKCKLCIEKINLKIFGMPNDLCWSCFKEKKEILHKNIDVKFK